MIHLGTISAETWSNLQGNRLRTPLQLALLPVILRIELVERYITDLILSRLQSQTRLTPRPPFFAAMSTTPSLTHQKQALVELVHQTVVSQPQTSLLRRLKSLPALEHARASRIQCPNRQEREDERQTKTNVDSLKNTIITTTDRFRIELLQTSSEQITPLSLLRILAHLLHTITQNPTHELSLTRNLRRVLRHVLDHGPEIQQGPPIYVAKIRKKHMRLETTHKLIITRKTRIPLTLTTT